ncbi:hypothetical protein [Streptomyces sp. NPDC001658]
MVFTREASGARSLHGLHMGELPEDDTSFLEFALALPDPSIAELVARAEPVSGISLHRFPVSRRRHFERLPEAPAGLSPSVTRYARSIPSTDRE